MKKLFTVLIIILFTVPALAQHTEWRWKSEVPKQFFIFGPPETQRKPEIFDAAFEKLRGPIKFKKVVSVLGKADYFSPQSIYSLRKGGEPDSKQTINSSGTYRYLLKDGGEVHIWVLPGDLVGTAIRYERNGKGHLLYK